MGDPLQTAETLVKVPGCDEWQTLTSEREAPARVHFESVGLASYRSEHLVVLMGLGTSLGLQGQHLRAPAMWDLFERVKKLPGFEHTRSFAKSAIDRQDVEALLSSCQMHASLTDDRTTHEFLQAAEQQVLAACNFVDETTDLTTHEAFLRKVGRRSTRLSRAQIFTTNYDLAIEHAAQRTRFTLLDGFGPAARELFDGGNFELDIVRRASDGSLQLAPNVIQLYKLHGSVDWTETPTGVRRQTPPDVPVLIYPSSMKYQQSYRPPYLESMARFQMTLRQPETTLIVAGFGFNDAHLAAPIMAAVHSNVSLRIIVVDPKLKSSPNESMSKLIKLSDAGDNRLLLVASKFGDFTSQLPDVALSDIHEAHGERLRATSGTL